MTALNAQATVIADQAAEITRLTAEVARLTDAIALQNALMKAEPLCVCRHRVLPQVRGVQADRVGT
jgi:hypothetical protein